MNMYSSITSKHNKIN